MMSQSRSLPEIPAIAYNSGMCSLVFSVILSRFKKTERTDDG
ncbi:hypothetical protein RUMTOR_00609 [[Ruminococcus] torques ATCC 27756]|uniref:Uncharacterized protein n=1 Tax=[Ruminococcus] torques ATCC 27756 TaxID=411460 RepID=A5KK60_9FIRM|nr:hypothetical protein RUMTOR_00609 [[Ruminococcus] torques ATCC 27756]